MHAASTARQPAHDVFVSYNWRDQTAVHAIAQHLRAAGLTPFLDRWYLIPGQPWQPVLERALQSCAAVAVFLGPGEMGRWQHREMQLALSRQTRTPDLPVIPVLLPGADPALCFLNLNTRVDLRDNLEDPAQLAILAAAVRGQPPGPDLAAHARAAASAICPFRGLLYFREEDQPFFFGRAHYAQQLAGTVERQNFTALVAASGAGKSSLVRAGLIPLLRGSRTHAWDVVTLFPTDRPLRSLASALLLLLEPEMTETDRLAETAKLAAYLATDVRGLRDVAERILAKQPGTDRLLLVVDQWEEIYTLAAAQDRQCFIDHILNAGPLVHIVATLRGDFTGRALEYRRLSDRMQGAQFNLGPMTRDELESTITGPAAKTGLGLEDGLTARLLEDAAAEPANLPLLEFVLRRLWEERDGPELTHAVYEHIGGLRGALTRHADAVFARLTPLEQQTARQIFLQVVRPAGEGGYTRRRACLEEVGEPAWDLVQKLARERLLVTARVAADPETVEVCHEALITHWALLRGWLNDAQEFLLWRERFRGLFDDWRRHQRDPERLLHGPACAEAQGWLARDAESLSAEQREFVAASVRQRDERAQGELRKAQERIEEQRRAARRLKLALAAVAAGLMVAGGFYYESRRQRDTAVSARNQAEELVRFLLFSFWHKLEPIGRLDLMDDVNRRIDAYYDALGEGSSVEVQRRRSAALINRGDVLVAQGRLDAALSAHQSSLYIAKRLAQQDGSNTLLQRDLSISFEKVGDVLVLQGKLDAALTSYQFSRAIRERLAQQEANNTEWQRDLSVSHFKIGSVLMLRGELDAALSAHQFSRAIAEKLTKEDANNTRWLRDLSVSHNNVGDVLVAQGKLDAALSSYQSSRDITERLLQQEASNTLWQFDLANSYGRVGGVLQAQGRLDAAVTSFRFCQAIMHRLAQHDTSNTLWQRNLSVSHERVGDVLVAQGKLDAAFSAHQSSRLIRERLAKQDASNAQWQRDLALSDMKIGDILAKQGNRQAALTALQGALAISERLAAHDPTNAIWRDDLAWVRNRIETLRKAAGRK